MINVHVYPEIAMMDQDVGDVFVVSIGSPGYEKNIGIKGTNVHRFLFHDITEEYFLENQNRVIRPMEKEIAERIVDIALKNIHKHNWIIHCEAGISRSPGVAIGLSKYIKLNPNRRNLKKMFPLYNKYVCKLIEDAMERRRDNVTCISE